MAELFYYYLLSSLGIVREHDHERKNVLYVNMNISYGNRIKVFELYSV